MNDTTRDLRAFIALCAVFVLAAPGAIGNPLPPSPLPSAIADPNLDPLLNATAGLDLEIHAPGYVTAGQSFSVLIELKIRSELVTIVQFLPIVVSAPCTMTEYHVTGGIPLAADYYFLTHEASLTPAVDTVGDPVELFNTLDMSMTFNAAQDLVGSCTPGATATELSQQLAGRAPYILSKAVSIVELPATPVFAGTVATTGGNDVDDHAKAIPSPILVYPVLVFTSKPMVAVSATIMHSESGPTVADDGYFEIRENGMIVNQETLSKSPDAKTVTAVRNLTHEKGKTITTTYCVYGVYVDDGVWSDEEGPDQTCVDVVATEPGDLTSNVPLRDEACKAFKLATTQAQLLVNNLVLVPRVPNVGILETPLGPPESFMFDLQFGAFCP